MAKAKKAQPTGSKGSGAGIPPSIENNWDEGNLHVLRMEINIMRHMGTPEGDRAVTGAGLGRLLLMILVARINEINHDCTQDDLTRIAKIVSKASNEDVAAYHAHVKLYNDLFTCEQYAMSEYNKARGFLYLLTERMIDFYSLDKELQNIKSGKRTTKLSRYENQRKAALFLPIDGGHKLIDQDGFPITENIYERLLEHARGIIADLSNTIMESTKFVLRYNDYITLVRKKYCIFELLGLRINTEPLLYMADNFTREAKNILADENLIHRELFTRLFDYNLHMEENARPPKEAIDAALNLMENSDEGHFGILRHFANAYPNSTKGSDNGK